MAAFFRARLDEARLGMMVLTRLPMGEAALQSGATIGRAVWIFPLAGALIGAICGGVYALALLVRLSPALGAALALAAGALATGCLHEDGLADFCDGIGGGRDRAAKLEIMRDSRIGTYGATALILSFLLRWSAVVALGAPPHVVTAWIAVGALSRAAMLVPLCFLPPARADGLGVQAASPPTASVIAAVALAIGIAGAAIGWRAVPVGGTILIVAGAVAIIAQRQLKGFTGDVLGACALASEAIGLAAATSGWL